MDGVLSSYPFRAFKACLWNSYEEFKSYAPMVQGKICSIRFSHLMNQRALPLVMSTEPESRQDVSYLGSFSDWRLSRNEWISIFSQISRYNQSEHLLFYGCWLAGVSSTHCHIFYSTVRTLSPISSSRQNRILHAQSLYLVLVVVSLGSADRYGMMLQEKWKWIAVHGRKHQYGTDHLRNWGLLTIRSIVGLCEAVSCHGLWSSIISW